MQKAMVETIFENYWKHDWKHSCRFLKHVQILIMKRFDRKNYAAASRSPCWEICLNMVSKN